MYKTMRHIFILFFMLFLCKLACTQEIKVRKGAKMILGSPFVNHAVLQQQKKIAVWGLANPNDVISAKLGGNQAKSSAQSDGYFRLYLPPMNASGPYTLTIQNQTTGETIQLDDILIGEVWICSGQSNMEWKFENIDQKQIDDFNQTNSASSSQVRFYQVPDMAWVSSTAENIGQFSAVAGWYGTKLHHTLGVPVGIIVSAWGGSRIESWIGTTEDANAESIIFAPKYIAEPDEQTVSQYAEVSTDGWIEMPVPGIWVGGKTKYADHGAVWFRIDLSLPEEWAGKDLVLMLPGVDKEDITYFNGRKIGKTGGNFSHKFYNKPRAYTIGAELVKTGLNKIAIRAYSWCFGGGFPGDAKDYMLVQKDDPSKIIPLAGDWKFSPEFGFDGYINNQAPDELYHYWLRPVMPYSARGFLWYQGCSNAPENEMYFEKTKTLLENWRSQWDDQTLPYYLVQLANTDKISDIPARGAGFAQIRDAQLRVLKKIQNTGLAVTIDIGETDNIHPKNKEDVANRLLLWALAKTYGKTVEYSGPIYREMKTEGSKIRILFDHAENGLMVGSKNGRQPVQKVKGGTLQQFAVAGTDRKWHWADALIDGQTVLVSSPEVEQPVAVRYAFDQNPDGCNLYNKAGLPASPFRTDDWK